MKGAIIINNMKLTTIASAKAWQILFLARAEIDDFQNAHLSHIKSFYIGSVLYRTALLYFCQYVYYKHMFSFL